MDVKNVLRSLQFDMLLRVVCLIQISFLVAADIHDNYLLVYEHLVFGLISIFSFMLAGFISAFIAYILVNRRVLLDGITMAAFLVIWLVIFLANLDAFSTIVILALETGIFSFLLGGFDTNSRFPLEREIISKGLKPGMLVPVALLSGILLHYAGIDQEYQEMYTWVAFGMLVGITVFRVVVMLLQGDRSGIMPEMPASARVKMALHGANWWRAIILIFSMVLLVVAFIEQLFFDILKLLIEVDATIYIYPGYQLYSFALYAVLAGALSAVLVTRFIIHAIKRRWARYTVGVAIFQGMVAFGVGISLLVGSMSLVVPTIFVLFGSVAFCLVYLVVNSGKRSRPSLETLKSRIVQKMMPGES